MHHLSKRRQKISFFSFNQRALVEGLHLFSARCIFAFLSLKGMKGKSSCLGVRFFANICSFKITEVHMQDFKMLSLLLKGSFRK